MDIQTIRLECLKLAAVASRDGGKMLEIAKLYEDYINKDLPTDKPIEPVKSEESPTQTIEQAPSDNLESLL